METPVQSQRSYKFKFWKDRFWIWASVLPFGLICWAIPFVLFFGLLNSNNSPDWFPVFGFLFLGVPAYLIGWIFVYSLMEGFYTRVTIASEWISIRLPWLIFPLFPVVKRIEINEIHRVDLFARYGSRIAVFLYYYARNKERHFYIPMFLNNPAYKQEMFALQKRVEGLHSTSDNSTIMDGSTQQAKMERLQALRQHYVLKTSFFERFVHFLDLVTLVVLFAGSCWITSSIPPGGIAAVEVGFSVAFVFTLMGLAGLLPVIGQVLIWFFGHWAIINISRWFFHISTDTILWETPGWLNDLLAKIHIQPVQTTYTEFLFWSVLIFSILVSLDATIGWLRRRVVNRRD